MSRPSPVPGTSSEAWPSGSPGTSSLGCSVPGSSAVRACETCDSGSTSAVSTPGGSQSARSAAVVDRVGGRAGEQGPREPLEVALADPPAALELVGVPGDRGRGQLVDVGEDQLGELRELTGVDPRLHRHARHVAPRGAGPDPVGREERLDRTSAAGLAAPELVGALDRRGLRGVDVLAGGEGEEPAEGELHRVADHLTHPAAPGAGIAGHLVDDGEHGTVGDLGEVRAQRGGHLGVEPDDGLYLCGGAHRASDHRDS